jgi:hypothetical protein
LDLYVQEDGTLDPRYHKFFQTSWTCNKDKGQAWSESQAKLFEKNIESPEISTMQINETTGELVRVYSKFEFDEKALEFIRPGEERYALLRFQEILYFFQTTLLGIHSTPAPYLYYMSKRFEKIYDI